MDASLIPDKETHPSISTVPGKRPFEPFGATESSGVVKGASNVEYETSRSKYKAALKRHDLKSHDPTPVLRQNALESLKSQSRHVSGKKTEKLTSGSRSNTRGEPMCMKEDAVEAKESSMEAKSYQQALLNSNTRMLEAEKNAHLLQQECDLLKNSLKARSTFSAFVEVFLSGIRVRKRKNEVRFVSIQRKGRSLFTTRGIA